MSLVNFYTGNEMKIEKFEVVHTNQKHIASLMITSRLPGLEAQIMRNLEKIERLK